MPIILAIETSSELASVALSFNGEVLTRETSGVQSHSQTVLPMVREVLAQAGIGIARCNAITFGCGPGSFTGVRTACGLAQGLAFGADLPVIPVVTLEAMAHGCRKMTGAPEILPVLDARMGEVYWARYRYDDEWTAVIEPVLSAPDAVQISPNNVVCGNGISAYQDRFQQMHVDFQFVDSIQVPHAAQIVELAESKFRKGQFVSAQEAQPLYLRNKIAFTSAERAARITS